MKYYLEDFLGNSIVFDETLAKKVWGGDNDRLYLSSKGNYINRTINEKKMLNKYRAAAWFLLNDLDLPEELVEVGKDMVQ